MTSDMWLPSLWGRNKDEENPFRALQKRMDNLFEDFGRGWLEPLKVRTGVLVPRIDVSETDKEIEITAELPGIEEKDVDVSVSERRLTIKGEKKSEKEEKDRQFYRMERSFGSFQRSMTLPYDIDSSQVSAEFKNGILTVKLAKPPEVQEKTRKIEVKSG